MREPKENASSLSLFRVSRGIIDQLNGPLWQSKGLLMDRVLHYLVYPGFLEYGTFLDTDIAGFVHQRT